jgi:hypothetical protein
MLPTNLRFGMGRNQSGGQTLKPGAIRPAQASDPGLHGCHQEGDGPEGRLSIHRYTIEAEDRGSRG